MEYNPIWMSVFFVGGHDLWSFGAFQLVMTGYPNSWMVDSGKFMKILWNWWWLGVHWNHSWRIYCNKNRCLRTHCNKRLNRFLSLKWFIVKNPKILGKPSLTVKNPMNFPWNSYENWMIWGYHHFGKPVIFVELGLFWGLRPELRYIAGQAESRRDFLADCPVAVYDVNQWVFKIDRKTCVLCMNSWKLWWHMYIRTKGLLQTMSDQHQWLYNFYIGESSLPVVNDNQLNFEVVGSKRKLHAMFMHLWPRKENPWSVSSIYSPNSTQPLESIPCF